MCTLFLYTLYTFQCRPTLNTIYYTLDTLYWTLYTFLIKTCPKVNTSKKNIPPSPPKPALNQMIRNKNVMNNHSTQDSRVVPHRGTNWAALWLTAQIGRDAVLSESYGRGYQCPYWVAYKGIHSIYYLLPSFMHALNAQVQLNRP